MPLPCSFTALKAILQGKSSIKSPPSGKNCTLATIFLSIGATLFSFKLKT